MYRSIRRLTLCQQNDSCSNYDKNDYKFGCSKEVLHITCQFDTQTVDGCDDHCKKTENVIIYFPTYTFIIKHIFRRRLGIRGLVYLIILN